MIQKILPYLILLQIFIGLFHAGMGIDSYFGGVLLSLQNFFVLALSLATLGVYLRIKATPISHRSWKIIFEHAVFIGLLAWLFHYPWGTQWEILLVIYLSVNISILLLILIFESQYGPLIGYQDWGISDFFWKLGALLTLINCITLPLVFIILNENLAVIWIFFGVSWLFLWKQDLS